MSKKHIHLCIQKYLKLFQVSPRLNLLVFFYKKITKNAQVGLFRWDSSKFYLCIFMFIVNIYTCLCTSIQNCFFFNIISDITKIWSPWKRDKETYHVYKLVSWSSYYRGCLHGSILQLTEILFRKSWVDNAVFKMKIMWYLI